MSNKGYDRERQVRRVLERDGWWVARAAGSLGDADLVASRDAGITAWDARDREVRLAEVQLVEVKANTGSPWMNFRPRDREELSRAAKLAGGTAWLVHWPPRGGMTWYGEDEWPA